MRVNALISLSSGVLTLVLAVGTLPYIVNNLGVVAFGLYSALGLMSGTLALLDCGFSWTTARFTAHALETNDRDALASLIATTIILYTAIGLLGGAILIVVGPSLVFLLFQVPPELAASSTAASRMFGVGFVFTMVQTGASAVLRGASRFGLQSAVQILNAFGLTVGTFAILSIVGGGVRSAAFVYMATQFVGSVIATLMALFVIRPMISGGRPRARLVGNLAGFTGGVLLSNIGTSLFYLPNRLAVALILPLSQITLFSVPFTSAQRVLMVPVAFGNAGLTALSSAAAVADRTSFPSRVLRLAAITLALIAAPVLLGILWAPTILAVWFSPSFGESSAWVLRWGLIAVTLNSLAGAFAVGADAAGRPRVPAIASLLSGCINVLLAIWLTRWLGIAGAAFAAVAGFAFYLAALLIAWESSDIPSLATTLQAASRRLAIDGRHWVLPVGAWLAAAWLVRSHITSRPLLVAASLGFLVPALVVVAAAVGALPPAIYRLGREQCQRRLRLGAWFGR